MNFKCEECVFENDYEESADEIIKCEECGGNMISRGPISWRGIESPFPKIEYFYCELHKCACRVDQAGFGGCGDYNKNSVCIWSTKGC